MFSFIFPRFPPTDLFFFEILLKYIFPFNVYGSKVGVYIAEAPITALSDLKTGNKIEKYVPVDKLLYRTIYLIEIICFKTIK